MYCSKCAVEIPDDANFCYKCAHPVTIGFTSQNAHARRVEPLGDLSREEILNEIFNFEEKRPAAKKQKNSAVPIELKPQTIVVKSGGVSFGGLVGALSFLILCALGVAFYVKNKQHTYFDFKVTDKGIELNSDGFKGLPSRSPVSSSTGIDTNVSRNSTPGESTRIEFDTESETRVPTNVVGNGYNEIACWITNNSNPVNLRRNCDVRDCDTDDSTIVASLDDQSEVFLFRGNFEIQSKLGFEWWTVNVNGAIYYVASSKLNCAMGE